MTAFWMGTPSFCALRPGRCRRELHGVLAVYGENAAGGASALRRRRDEFVGGRRQRLRDRLALAVLDRAW